jgi:hypothetical protein
MALNMLASDTVRAERRAICARDSACKGPVESGWKMVRWYGIRRLVLQGGIATLIALAATAKIAAAGGQGTIRSLVVAPQRGDQLGVSFTITSVVVANSDINNSNIKYILTDPNGADVALPAGCSKQLSGVVGGTPVAGPVCGFSNSAFTVSGTYTVTICWSKGGSSNCQIIGPEDGSTSFFSVPTLGWPLGLMALGLLAVFLWRRREDFAEVAA